jgi:multidrug efflux pump subunit AcrA (membrane-fusion protein)
MKSSFTEILRMILPVAILTGGILTYAGFASFRQPPKPVEQTESLPLAEVVPIEAKEGGLDLIVDGVVVPFREISLSAEVGGRITHKAPECRAGRYVTKGTLLAQIDPRTYQLEVDRLGQEVEQANGTLTELDVEIENTKSLLVLADETGALRARDLERMEALYRQRAGSESELDEARHAELNARNNIATLRNQLRMAEAKRTRLTAARDLAITRLDQAKIDLEKSQIRAPIDGVIVTESIEQESFVQPGTPLYVIEDTSAVEVRCSLRMEELNWIWQQKNAREARSEQDSKTGDYHLPQTKVTISYRLGQREYQWEGNLSRYEGIGLDERTRTVPCRVLVPQPREMKTLTTGETALNGGLKALVRGMYVKIAIHVQPDVALLKVPEQALQPGNIVWCLRDDKIRVIPLRNVTMHDNLVLVPESPEGLHDGDKVVITPLLGVTDGMPVRIHGAPLAQK